MSKSPTNVDTAETTGPMDLPASSINPPAKEIPQPEADASVSAVEASLPSVGSSAPIIDSSQPPIESSFAAVNAPISSIESSLPDIDKSIPSLDTTLSGIDTTASVSEAPPLEPQLPSSSNAESSGAEHAAPAPGVTNNIPTNLTGESHHPSTSTFTSPPNGTYNYMQGSAQQSQFQAQPQPQQNNGMYTTPQPPSMPASAPATQTVDNNAIQTQQSQPGQVPQAPIGSPMPSNMPSMSSMDQYMQSYSTNPMGLATSPQMQYQMAGDSGKMLSGSRHKKEVKRRTKTGCLTCRKRRIKCDEGHPVCRNCVKSKRECLGYDPVFRAQTSTPSAIQPSNPPPSLVVNPQDPSAFPGPPPGYVPAAPQSLGQSESPSASADQFEQGTNVDPSLQSNPVSDMASLQSAVDGSLPSQGTAPTTGPPPPAAESSGFKVKQVQVADLIALRGIPPPPPHPIVQIQPNRFDEIQAVYLATYSPAIDKLLETRWFQENGLPHLLANAQLMAEYSALIDAFNDRNIGDPSVMARLESFEASVVWSTMVLCRHVMSVSNGSNGAEHKPDNDLTTAATRLDVIEALITGEHTDSNLLSQYPVREPAANPPSFPDQIVQRSLDFWSTIGHFLTLHDDEASSAKEIDDTLARTRTLLDTLENRDVIYSIAIARHLGQRWADFPRSFPHPITTNEKDAGAKLYVAQKFLEQEASGKGTTQVVVRLCGMVLRSWIVSRE